MPFPLIAAAIGAVGALGAAKMDNNSQKKSLAQAERQRAQSLEFIQKQLAQSRSDLFQLFPQAQQSRQQGQQAGLNVFSQAFPAAMGAFQDGNVMAQQQLLAGLPQMNNALLGKEVDLSGLQAQRVPVNAQALQGLFNPQALQFDPMRSL